MNNNSIHCIDIDNIDWNLFKIIVETCGSFELVGKTMDNLAKYVKPAINLAKEIFDQPLEDLLKTVPEGQNKFHGFQDVKTMTLNKEYARDQIAFHFKPYLSRSLPNNIKDDKEFHDYWNNGIEVIHKLYNEITNLYTPIENRTKLNNDDRSVLTNRRYLNNIDGNIGVEPHSDAGLLTLITSDEDGLEFLQNGEWIKTSSKPYYRFYVNIGDWMLFQTGNYFNYIAGIHRVPKIQHGSNYRHSLIIFLNPAWEEEIETPSGKIVTYKEYLFSSNKTVYFK